MPAHPLPRFRPAALLALALAAGSCSGGGTTDPQPTELRLLVVGLVRHDLSPQNQLQGGLAFFFDRDAEVLLTADARIIGPQTWELQDSLPVGVIPGAIYHRAPNILPGQSWRLQATVFGPDTVIQIESESELVPSAFEVRGAAMHPANQPLRVEWDAVPDAEFYTVAAGSGYEVELSGSETSHTIPAIAFTDVTPGAQIEIEVTAFNNFYISVAAGISSLDDAQEISDRFLQRDNVTGANGTFGAATSVGYMLTIQ